MRSPYKCLDSRQRFGYPFPDRAAAFARRDRRSGAAVAGRRLEKSGSSGGSAIVVGRAGLKQERPSSGRGAAAARENMRIGEGAKIRIFGLQAAETLKKPESGARKNAQNSPRAGRGRRPPAQ